MTTGMRVMGAIGLAALLVATCATRGNVGVSAAATRTSAPDTTLAGHFRWVTLDGRAAPAEFPAGSGARLEEGSLELHPTPRDSSGFIGRFALRFGMRATPADSVRSSGPAGRYRLVADSLHFTPDGREGRPPVRFRYAWRADSLVLTDMQGHAWGYVRR